MAHLITHDAAWGAWDVRQLKAHGYPKSCLHRTPTPSTLHHTGNTRGQPRLAHLPDHISCSLAAIRAHRYQELLAQPSPTQHVATHWQHRRTACCGCCWQGRHSTACLGLSPAGDSPSTAEPASSPLGEVPSCSPWEGSVGLSAALHMRVRLSDARSQLLCNGQDLMPLPAQACHKANSPACSGLSPCPQMYCAEPGKAAVSSEPLTGFRTSLILPTARGHTSHSHLSISR